MSNVLVDCAWLHEHLDDKDLVLLDAFMLKVVGKEPIEYPEFVTIPGALPFDIENDFCNNDSTQLHALPTSQLFTDQVQKLGINKQSKLVIFDNQGIYSAPRAWWTFKVMGFDNVKVLDGGLPAWIEKGYPTTSAYSEASGKGDFVASCDSNKVTDYQTVLSELNNPQQLVVDARGSARFNAEVAEPRPGVRAGRIPNSVNLPFASLMEGNGFKSKQVLSQLFSNIDTADSERMVFSCGSGITACILILAAHEVGRSNTVLYDGSWAEWGSNEALPLGE
ncbi:sulfurtransferase [Vibrio breoganii]|uniref:sulfurtransferase n=1 Tax=Vibrio breoganii TaxID=553239 RepID=UPI000C816639|nr:sulfurtransferase [Vibrio breoganii]PMM01539.1 3-mercaptopyruvate sulfurtransferase [Vibrio breoganii]PMN61316.1 3-mercaptopyruvate sulfurtransferase [Vibrio breoganii]